ncbi:MAG: haloacid dehalogenase-like hydrolase [Anaerolineae bacterium]|nr:haloacid dehalogenase-like hydrolase [Anaerolineae bacterium]
MQPKWLVLFDIDGTLLKSGGCGRAATRLAMQDVFGTIGALDTLSFAGKTDWQILRETLEPTGISAEHIHANLVDYEAAVGHHLTAIVDQFPVQACPGTLEVVAALRANPSAVVGLVTGNVAALVPIKLRAAGFDPADFEVGAFGSEGWDRAMLPPLALQRAREHSGMDFPGEHIVVIGDTPGDIQCAASIQARTLAVATGPFNMAQLRAHQPTYTFETMQDHHAVLNAILCDGRDGPGNLGDPGC